MVSFGSILASIGCASSKVRLLNVCWRILAFFGCVVFLASMLSPFLEAHWLGLSIPERRSSWPGEMWSFKQRFYYWSLTPATFAQVELAFGQYWAQDWFSVQGVAGCTGCALMLMFFLQVLTIILGILATFKSSHFLTLLPTLLSSSIAILAFTVFSIIPRGYAKTLQPRFWLALLSIALFKLTVMVHYFSSRRARIDTS